MSRNAAKTVSTWDHAEVDEAIAQELREWLPARIFDAHTHLYRRQDLGLGVNPLLDHGPEEAGEAEWRSRLERLLGDSRLDGGLYIAFPTAAGDLERSNAYVVEQAEGKPMSRASISVGPSMERERVAELARRPCVAGLKPYHVLSPVKPTFQARLSTWLPEWAWQIADERGLAITIHLVRDRALDDPDNKRELLKLCARYPRAKVILAHAGRGFHAPNTIRGVEALQGLQNVWFDAAAVCEPEPLLAILETFGPHRLLWGSDFPVSQQRGRCVTIGDGFVWVDTESVLWEKVSPACSPALVGVESLRAIKSACDQAALSRDEIEAVFRTNAVQLLGIESAPEGRTASLYARAKTVIPGGVQLLSKRPEMFAPGSWPAYFREARGCEVWDMDGRHFFDMSTNGVGACLLGYRHPAVTNAVKRRLLLGSNCTLNPPEDLELADELCRLHPWAEQVRLTRTGGETAVVAVRIARATADRSAVLVCGYHGWHDWYLAANLGEDDALRGHLLPGLAPLGVPRELRGTAFPFKYNDRAEFDAALAKAGDKLAAVVMEPCRYLDPEPGFLEYVRDRTHAAGGLLVFDEITIGLRLCLGGAHLKLGVNPDIAFFAKSLGNGHPIGAIIGTRAAMEGAHKSFISSTYWTEAIGPAAALATLRTMGSVDVPSHVERIGRKVHSLWQACASRHGLPVACEPGYPCMAHFRFDHPQSEALRTLYTQLMLDRGFLSGANIYPTLAHTDEIVERFGSAIDEVFKAISRALSSGTVEKSLKGPVAHSGFRRLL